jgi:hypothetical protein
VTIGASIECPIVNDILAGLPPSETTSPCAARFAGTSQQIEIVTTTLEKLKAAMHRLYGPPIPHDVDVFGRRNILIGPIRDHLMVELVDRGAARRQRPVLRVGDRAIR